MFCLCSSSGEAQRNVCVCGCFALPLHWRFLPEHQVPGWQRSKRTSFSVVHFTQRPHPGPGHASTGWSLMDISVVVDFLSKYTCVNISLREVSLLWAPGCLFTVCRCAFHNFKNPVYLQAIWICCVNTHRCGGLALEDKDNNKWSLRWDLISHTHTHRHTRAGTATQLMCPFICYFREIRRSW